MIEPSRATLLDFAVELAHAAGGLALQHYQKNLEIERKADASPVTVADRAAEQLLRERIAKRFPDDAILGEEFGEVNAGAARRWVLDPIDGTRTFVRGVPLFGVLLAVEIDGQPDIGVIHVPALGETVSAARGLGCRWNDRPARVSTVDDLSDALVLTTDIENIERRAVRAGWDRLRARAGLCRTWGDCYGYALLATGRAECMIDPIVAHWDAAPLVPIIEEAGGIVTDLAGTPGSLVATNAALAHSIRALLQEVP